jgi:hypothetical protein
MSLLTQASLILTPTAYKDNKLYSVVPSNGNGDLTFTRATTATRINSSGVIETVASNVPRLDYSSGTASILLEPQRTNLLLNSGTLSTQSVTTTAVSYSLSFYGTGTITLSGSYSGTLIGTGISNRVTLTFTPTAGTLTLTVSGTCTNAQFEAGDYATSYIPTTTSIVTRNKDLSYVSGISDLIGQTEGVLYVESAGFLKNELTNGYVSLSNDTATNRILIGYDQTSNIISFEVVVSGTFVAYMSYNISDITQLSKIAVRYNSATGMSLWVNGVKRANSAVTTIPNSMSRLAFNNGNNFSSFFYAKVKSVQIYKTALTDAECASLTTL